MAIWNKSYLSFHYLEQKGENNEVIMIMITGSSPGGGCVALQVNSEGVGERGRDI